VSSERGGSRRFGIRFEQVDPPPGAAAVAEAFACPPGAYLHIPFCRPLCPFCPYNKVPYAPGPAAGYFRALHREVSAHLAVLRQPFTSLYVGGGTPTLCLPELQGVVERLPVTGERAIEVLPTHMTPEGAHRLRDLGFDYVSLGVQSLDARTLHRLQRPGSPRTTQAAIENALGVFDCVDVDLVFDTAYDDPATLLHDLEVCFGYGVDQVSTYPLMRFGYTPFGTGGHDRRREHELLRTATELGAAHGYRRRSVWTFHRNGSPTYTSITRPYYLGLGAGAATFAGNLFLVNHFGLDQYQRAVAAGRLPVARTVRLPRAAAAAYRTFWQAYTGSIPRRGDDPLLAHPVSGGLRALTRLAGWSRRDGDALALTPSGYDRYHDLERWVTYHLIEPLWAELMAEHDVPAAVRTRPAAVEGTR
jgi:oxygen-independent coproporphyrinogen-3 oxidase